VTRRRIPLAVRLERRDDVPAERPGGPTPRAVRPDDREALAVLLYAAYRGAIDDEGETFADAVTEIEKTWQGAYGRFLPGCSFVLQEGEFLSSACLVSFFAPHDAPLVVFLMTRPEHKRRGLARLVLERSMNALLSEGYERITLVVTDGNEPAQRLYTSLGFTEIPTASNDARGPSRP